MGAAIVASACGSTVNPAASVSSTSASASGGGSSTGSSSGGTGGYGGHGGSGGAGPTDWSITAHVPVPALGTSGAGTEMSAHPTDPKTVSFAVSVPGMNMMSATRTGCTTADLGVTAACTTIATVPGALSALGFGYDPAAPSNLIDALGVAPKPLLYVSADGGKTYAPKPGFANLSSTAVLARFVGGATSAIVVRTQNEIRISTDEGATYGQSTTACQPPSSGQDRSVAVSPLDPSQRLVLCAGSAPVRCLAQLCAPIKMPAGLTLDEAELSPHDGNGAVGLAHGADQKGVLVSSTDGGKSFSAGTATMTALAPKLGKIVFDRRASSPAVVVSVIKVGGSTFVWRSLDAGKTFEDITPPASLEPAPGSFSTVDFDIAADGAVLALSNDGTLARLAPRCTTNSDCAGSSVGPVCDPAQKRCVACLTSADCKGLSPVCDPFYKTCGACHADADCKVSPQGRHCGSSGSCTCGSDADCATSSLGAHCDATLQRCGCSKTADCAGAAHPLCQVSQSSCVDGCTVDLDCKMNIDGPICDSAGSKLCVGCLKDADCASDPFGSICNVAKKTCGCTTTANCGGILPVCDPSAGRCTTCLTNADCASNPSKPVCNTAAPGCAECVTNADCKNPAKPTCVVPPGTPLTSYCN